MKQTDRPITAIKVNNPEIRDIINKLSEPIHRERFSNPLQFRRTCSTNEFRFNGARCGNGALKKRERENRNREKKGVKGTRDAFTPACANTQQRPLRIVNAFPASPRVFPREKNATGSKRGTAGLSQHPFPISRPLSNHPHPLGRVDALSKVFFQEGRKGRERNLRFPRSRPIGLLEPVPICHWHAIASSRLSGWPRQKVYGTCQETS